MKTFETQAVVSATGAMMIQLQTNIPQGIHPVVLVINPQPNSSKRMPPLKFGRYAVGLINNDFTFRREDLYAKGDLFWILDQYGEVE
jgi:hypothetical protein